MGSGWEDNLRVVDTIYEEENDMSSSSPSLSQSLSPPPAPLHARVESWSMATGKQADVSIYVMGTCFRLHKEPLISRSGYLKRQLTELSEITLPLNITAETFSQVADFCYGTHVVITPFNVASLRTAAELLEMTSSTRRNGENLSQVTETYFRRVVTVNSELAMIVFRSCLRLLPEAETTAALVSRCVESLDLARGVEEELDECVEQIINLPAEEFMIIAEAFQCRFGSHDFLYRLVDLYIKDQSSKITEEQKAEICNIIDCEKLSPHFLIQAVQNPRLPLRFIVRAMLIEQLNTRRAMFTAANTASSHHTRAGSHSTKGFTTLGSILRRDAVARDAAQMKVEMNATSSRIESLEKELAGMKKLLQKSEKEIRKLREKKLLNDPEKVKGGQIEERVSHKFDDDQKLLIETGKKERSFMESIPEELLEDREGRSVMESSRSSSFHYGPRNAEIKRGEMGSISFASSRFGVRKEGAQGCSPPSPSGNGTPRSMKNLSRKGLISRLKNTFWASKPASKYGTESKASNGGHWNGVGDGDEVVIVTREVANPAHNRRHSLGQL